MKCEICKREVGEEGVIVKTKGISKGVEYHLECFDDMWSCWEEMHNKDEEEISCDTCHKCGSINCGNDTKNFECWES